MTSLLEDQGIKVLVISMPDSVSGLTCLVRRPRHKTNVPVIVVNDRGTLERRRLTLAHELTHQLIDATSPLITKRRQMSSLERFLFREITWYAKSENIGTHLDTTN